MIHKFSTVCAGHVDLDDMTQMATPANERRDSSEHLTSVFEKTGAIARCMDRHKYVRLSSGMGTPGDVMLEQLAWLGKEGMPSVKGR